MKAKKVTVRAGSATYPVLIGANLERELVEAVSNVKCSRIAVIVDSTVKRLWGSHIMRVLKKTGRTVELISFPHGEKNKNQRTVTALQHELLKRHYGRDTLIVAVGGGVVGDTAGFVAATYMRGLPYIQVPTTVLAMVDSSIGGKVGVDTRYGKNTIGAFWHPEAVIADLRFLSALPRQQLVSGLMEAVKEFCTFDKSALSLVQKIDLRQPLKTANVLQEVIYRSVLYKARVVRGDERESGKRQILNFGHTIGHAVEHLSHYKIPHGFAVAYGMLAEAKIAAFLGILSDGDYGTLREYLASFGIHARGIRRFSIPAILHATRSDKKSRGGKARYVLLSAVGKTYVRRGEYAHHVSDTVVGKALGQLRAE